MSAEIVAKIPAESRKHGGFWKRLWEMYSFATQRIIFLSLGVIGIVGIVGGLVLAFANRAVPDSVISLSSAAVGALAMAANSNGHKEQQQTQTPEIDRIVAERRGAGLDGR